jgi:NhaP-type Na+/H+ or K+/H+ antiporter
MTWVLWGFMLLVQNASHTWTSRARNSRSLRYHAVAAVFSNGVWFVSLGVAVDKIRDAQGDPWLFAATALFYTVCTVIGSVGMHHILMTRVETGNRCVG